ncbi:MAG: transporter substrate-binding domain-containing protein [Planctomycetota bacterium]|jgi:polar amino acid transport system substrate-binding protein|nr:transporter substrate-binding domain-containing protein [Planctomycetota bacterium]
MLRTHLPFLAIIVFAAATSWPTIWSGEGADAPKPHEYRTIADFDGRHIGAVRGTMLADALKGRIKDPQLRFYDSLQSLMAALRAGEIDAIVDDEPICRAIALEDPRFVVFEAMLQTDTYAFAHRKENLSLGYEVNASLRELMDDGMVEALAAKWMDGPVDEKVMSQIPTREGKRLLRFGTSPVSPPFSYLNDKNECIGLDIELAERLALRMERDIEIVTIDDFGDMFSALLGGDVDMIGGCITVTEERAHAVEFTIPYYEGGVTLVTMSASLPTEVDRKFTARLSDLNGKRIGVFAGTMFDAAAREHLDDIRIQYFVDNKSQVRALSSGRIDAMITDEPVARLIASMHDDIGILAERLQDDDYAFALHYDDRELHFQVGEVIRDLKADGTIDAMTGKWLDGPMSEKTLPEFPVPDDAPPLRLGVGAVMEPFSYHDGDGNLTGFDIELARRIAQRLGRRLIIVTMEVGSRVPSLLAKTIDMAGTCMTITRQRAKLVNFTESYYRGGVSALVSTR